MQPLKICTELISLKIEAVWVLILLKDSYLGAKRRALTCHLIMDSKHRPQAECQLKIATLERDSKQ